MKVELRYNNLSSPISLSQNKSEKDITYIGDQVGIIYQDADSSDLEIFMDIQFKVGNLNKDYDEKGLLDFAFAPNYPKDNRLFIFYSTQVSESIYINYLSEITVN